MRVLIACEESGVVRDAFAAVPFIGMDVADLDHFPHIGRQCIAGRQVTTGRPKLAFSEFHPIHPRSECRACASAFSALVFFGAFTSAGNNAASAHIAASARFGLCAPV